MKSNNSDISVQQLGRLSSEDYICLDIRDEIAYRHGHIPGAVYWDGSDDRLADLPRDKKLIVYCVYGEKSEEPANALRSKGFDAYNLTGGYREWLLNHFEELGPEEIRRYDRQMILPQVGSDGQKKLKRSKVLIVGAGGLGSPAASYLAGAGVGTIGIMDADTVNVSNLQRQIIHNIETEDVNKAESAKIFLQKLNDHIKINVYPYALTEENAEEVIREYDFVIDAVDNFEAKFLINDTCVSLGKPFCHAGVLRFEGQVMTYVPGDDPCYRCIFEEIPDGEAVPNCSQAGILGAVAGIIGCIQALEAVKYFLDAGELLTGKMFVLDGLTMKTRLVRFPNKNQNCSACGGKKVEPK